MDNYNNFFDDQRPERTPKTPIYHTPDPPKNSGNNIVTILCIVLAVVMSVVVVVNVIVLASLKSTIASEYAASLTEQMKGQYEDAINDALNENNIVEDVIDAATNEALNALKSNIGELADSLSKSVARIYMFKSSTATVSDSDANPKSDSIASAFLITDTKNNSQRYLVTNAHCVTYVKETTTDLFPGLSETKYGWAEYGKIYCRFDGESHFYSAKIIAYGGYKDSDYKNLEPYNSQSDLALIRIEGAQPSNEDHPSLSIATSDYTKRGSSVALIGNPEGMGDLNSISTGCISQTGIVIPSWGNGTFILTDAAVNGGNSGGPMLNNRGVVVGVVESKLVSEKIDNMGFAISAGTLHDFIDWAIEQKNINVACKYEMGISK